MTLAHCISYAIYVRVLFIIKIVLSFTIDILLKILALIPLSVCFVLHVKTYRTPIFQHAFMSGS